MSLFESTKQTVYAKKFDYAIHFSNNIAYFSHQDVIKNYTIPLLHEKIDNEIIIIKNFIIKLKEPNKHTLFLINILQALLTEADYIIQNIKIEDFDEDITNKAYIILKYSNVIRTNYLKFEENNELIYSDKKLLHYSNK